MSTASQPHAEPTWKQEVNRRIAAHKNRKGSTATEQVPVPEHHLGNSRAAQAAARVAARYSKAPSYSQMQVEEARVAVRAAEIATQVALEAQAVAEEALAGLHAASVEQPKRGLAVVESITRSRAESVEQASAPVEEPESSVPAPELVPGVAAPVEEAQSPAWSQPVGPLPVVPTQTVECQAYGLRWEPDLPVRNAGSNRAAQDEDFGLAAGDWWTPSQVSATLHSEPIEINAPQAHANLIEFPRELVATRRMRPRLAEPVSAVQTESQLSIFEVDPGAISTEPAPAAEPSEVSQVWSGAEWSGIELDEHPMEVDAPQGEQDGDATAIHLAPFGRRLLAFVVDGALILAVFFAAAMMISAHIQHPPAVKTAEFMAVVGLGLTGLLYHAFFFAFPVVTPGMRYAGIALSTFADDVPSRAQLRHRLGAMILSLLPVGMGVAWSLFDDDHLTWHDRISQTYLRKRYQ